MFRSIRNKLKGLKLSMRMKLILSLSAIAVILLISSFLSIMTYSRMSSYVSDLIADNIRSINVAQKLASVTDSYNLEILAVIGDDTNNRLPDFDQEAFVAHCDSLRAPLSSNNLGHLADSVMYSFSAYMLASMELNDVILSDFIDTRTWYFERLQTFFNRLRRDIDTLNTAIYNELQANSTTFDRGFYRSIIPGAVAIGVGILLVLLLLSFILAYYVNPLKKMLRGLRDYKTMNKKYTITFEGDDELVELNEDILEITDENRELRKRIKALRESIAQKAE